MKTLQNYIETKINEGNISNNERHFREFKQMCIGYNCDIDNVCVRRTTKGNWAVYQDGKRRFTVSSNILNQSVVDEYNINYCD